MFYSYLNFVDGLVSKMFSFEKELLCIFNAYCKFACNLNSRLSAGQIMIVTLFLYANSIHDY